MAQILETQCGAGSRRNCNLKRTCQLRHSNEEAGKDLEYYTRKFARTSSVSGDGASLQPVLSRFPISDFDLEVAKGDGHCLIHAVLFLLEKRGIKCDTKPEFLKKIKDALQVDLDLYAPFIDALDTDPIEEMDAYVNKASYNSSISDLIVPIIVSILNIGIVVLELDNNTSSYFSNPNLIYLPSSELVNNEPLYLLKTGEHYDSLQLRRTAKATLAPVGKVTLDEVIELSDSLLDQVECNLASVSVGTVAAETENEKHDTDIYVLEEVDKETLSPHQSSNCEPLGAISTPEIPISDLGVSSHCEELDSERILASLCANAPDFEIRDCLRKYSCDYTLKRLKSVFNSINKPILEKTASYLRINTSNLKKPDIIHLLICKIQNLLPDTCQICNESYVCEINDSPFLPVNCVDKKSTKSVSCVSLG